jgi:DNA excision repair protein ERCC-2
MSEIEKALAELKALMKYRTQQLGHEEEFRGLGLTSRKNLCLHPSVRREKSGTVVDSRCRSLTAGFVKEKKERGEDVELCVYHDVRPPYSSAFMVLMLAEPRSFRTAQSDSSWSMDARWPNEIRRRAKAMSIFHCSANGMHAYLCSLVKCLQYQMPFCDVIIYSYHYLLDPKIAERVSKDLSKDCIVVFDEAHNIDNVCIESLSIDITEDSLRKATRGANNLDRKVSEMKTTDAQKLQDEYAKLVEGLREADEARQEDSFMANPGKSICSSY